MLHAAWKSLLGRKVRLVMSTFAIVLGVAFVAGTLVFTDTLSRSFTAVFASTVGDVVVHPKGGTTDDGAPTSRTLPARVVERLNGIDGAARVDGNVNSVGVFVVSEDGKVIGGQGAPGIGQNFTGAPAGKGLPGLQISSGRAPSAPGEVAIDSGTVERAGYELGDRVRLVSSGARASLSPTLVGIASFRGGGSVNGASITAFDTKVAQQLFLDGKNEYSDAWVTAEDGVSQEELRDRVAATLPAGYEALTGDKAADEAGSNLMEGLSFITTFLLIFAGISLVVGSFLIVNTFSILVAQRSRELALLRALGASARQVTRSVLFEAFLLGLLGATIGLGLGVLLAIGIRELFAGFGLDLSGTSLVFEPRTVIASYAVGVLVTVFAAYLPARRSAKIAPVSALRDDVAMPESALHWRVLIGGALVVGGAALMTAGLSLDVPHPGWWVGGGILFTLLGVAAAAPVIGRPFVALVGRLYAAAFGTVGRLAGQNSLRNPRRTAATASALMIGLALVSTMSILGASAKDSVDKTIEQNFLGDLVVSNVIGVPFSPSIADRIERTPGVESVTRLRYAMSEVAGDRSGLIGVDASTLDDVVKVDMISGATTDLREGTVMVTEEEAAKRGVGVGDTVSLKLPTGTKKYDVVGIYADNNPALFYPYTTTLDTLAEAGFPTADNYLMVTLSPSSDRARLLTTIEKQTAELPTVTVKDQQGYADEQRAPIDTLLRLIYALLALALIIAILGIVNTLALSVIERTREVGLLRAIGVSRTQLRRMIRLEAVMIAVLGAILGVAMGVVFGIVLMTSLKDEGLEVITVPGRQLAAFVVASGVVGVIAAILPARRAARLDVLRAIATE